MPRAVLVYILCATALISSACATAAEESGRPPLATPSGARSSSPDQAVGIRWQWISSITPIARTTVADPRRYTLLLKEGRAEVQFDCNSGGGTYTIGVGTLSFGPLISTRRACPADTQDALFMAQLQQVRSFFTERGELFLELPADAGTMRFTRAGDSPT